MEKLERHYRCPNADSAWSLTERRNNHLCSGSVLVIVYKFTTIIAAYSSLLKAMLWVYLAYNLGNRLPTGVFIRPQVYVSILLHGNEYNQQEII